LIAVDDREELDIQILSRRWQIRRDAVSWPSSPPLTERCPNSRQTCKSASLQYLSI